MTSCLEKRSTEARAEEIVRNDYINETGHIYGPTHPDALASSGKGKGTGKGGHTFWLPNCNGTLNVIDKMNFDTAYVKGGGAGNCDDVTMRDISMSRSLYSCAEGNRYYLDLRPEITEADGQYYVGDTKRDRSLCAGTKRLGFTK